MHSSDSKLLLTSHHVAVPLCGTTATPMLSSPSPTDAKKGTKVNLVTVAF